MVVTRRLDERVSARAICAGAVGVTLACLTLAATLTITRLGRAVTRSHADREARLILKAARLITRGALGADDLTEARRDLVSLLEASSLNTICVDLLNDEGHVLIHHARGGGPCAGEGIHRVARSVRFGPLTDRRRYRFNLAYRPNVTTGWPTATAYNLYTLALITVFAALIAGLVYFGISFADWVLGELSQTVRGRRARPPAIFGNVRIIELERVWNVVERLNAAVRSRALFEVSTRVAHDIRSPLSALNVVLSSAHDLPAERRALVRHALDRINAIATDLVTEAKRAKLAAGASDVGAAIAPPPLPLATMVERVVEEKILSLSPAGGVTLRTDLSDTSTSAEVDASEFARALSNLIDNAVEALPRGGTVTVGLRIDAATARVLITDDGIGIAPEHLALVGRGGFSFGKKNGAGGLGTGLAHARAVAESSGGTLGIQSRVAVGTIVTMSLPILAGQPPQHLGRVVGEDHVGARALDRA